MSKLIRVVLPVSDINLAEEFYTNILGVKGKRASAGKHIFNCEGVILVCYDPLSNGDKLGSGWMHHKNQFVTFSVKNLDATYFRFLKIPDVEIDSEIKKNSLGERIFYALDPFGNPICFVDEKTAFTSY